MLQSLIKKRMRIVQNVEINEMQHSVSQDSNSTRYMLELSSRLI